MAEVKLEVADVRLVVIERDPLAHVRKQIRDAFVTAVATTSLGAARVFGSRVYEIQDPPAAKIFTGTADDEEILYDLEDEQVRTLPVFVEIHVKAAATFDDDIDELCVQIEPVILADPRWGGIAKTTRLRRTQIEFSAEEEKPVARATLVYEVDYSTDPSDPETPI